MDNEIELMIDNCVSRKGKLSRWEFDFINSISSQYADTGSLSEKQKNSLDSIWERIT